MALVKPVIFQIVGFQNCGKTTLMVKLIEALKHEGIKTAAIKHHGHGGKPDIPLKKDSQMHLFAGALASSIEGDGQIILQMESSRSGLEDQIKLIYSLEPDLILVEGYKKERYPKLLLLRNEDDLFLLDQVTNIIGAMYWQEGLKGLIESKIDGPSFSIHDNEGVAWLVRMLKDMVK